jgi:hypothetical protein
MRRSVLASSSKWIRPWIGADLGVVHLMIRGHRDGRPWTVDVEEADGSENVDAAGWVYTPNGGAEVAKNEKASESFRGLEREKAPLGRVDSLVEVLVHKWVHYPENDLLLVPPRHLPFAVGARARQWGGRGVSFAAPRGPQG